MKKLLFFDVEYANTQNKAICQLGLLCETFPGGEPIFPEKNIFINPEDGFQDWCIKVHGITAKHVENEPNFLTVWNSIKKYFENSVIVGHNVLASDLIALSKSCSRYNIQLPSISYIDTMQIVRDKIPYFEIQDYSLQNLCNYFDIDTGIAHDAFDDACATSDLFKSLIERYSINIQDYIRTFTQQKADNFITYVADPVLKRTMSEFYGIIQGIEADNKIRPQEEIYIKNWKQKNIQFADNPDLSGIFKVLDKILSDNVLSIDEIGELKKSVKQYYETIIGSPVTISLQELRGILKGIIADNKITTEEGFCIIKWLYKNIHLSDYYPYNRISPLFEQVLKDGIITQEESDSLIRIINEILTPIQSLNEKIFDIEKKHICLSGNFSYGKKTDVEKMITKQGGFIDSDVKKTTDILVIGDYESQAYAHGNYGTKVRKAMEYNDKGCAINIIKEKDLFKTILCNC